jgi:transcriptional regulator with XRE-family HTH domain
VKPDALTISIINKISLLCNLFAVMTKKSIVMSPASMKEMDTLGRRLKDARLRRRFPMETVCARADISRPTLYKVENGDPTVAFGIYVNVLRVLGLAEDLGIIAKEDGIGRRIQDDTLPHRKRSPRRKLQKEDDLSTPPVTTGDPP